MASESEWSHERYLKLIEEYKNRELLWKKELYNKIIRKHQWEELASVMSCTSNVCKRKITNLRNTYHKQRMTILEDIKRGIDPSEAELLVKYQGPQRFVYKALNFLKYNDDYQKEIAEVNSARTKNDKDESSSSSIQNEGNTEPPKATRKRSLTPSYTETQVIMLKRHIVSTTTEEEPPVQPEERGSTPETTAASEPNGQPSSNRDEEIQHFLNYLGAKMKNYSQTTKNTVQHEISNIIFQADQNFYESNKTETLNDSSDDTSDEVKQYILDDSD